MVLLSVAVEYILVKMTSRLTDFPERTLFHSMSGNSGTRLAPRTLSFVSLRSMVWFRTIFLVSSWLGERKLSSPDSSTSQAKSVLSGARLFEDPCPIGDSSLGLLDRSFPGGSSSSCSESTDPRAYLAPRLAEICREASC